MAILMAISGNDNGNHGHEYMAIIMAMMAIIMAINGNNNGHQWQS